LKKYKFWEKTMTKPKDEKVAAQKEDARSALGRMYRRSDKENNFEGIPQ